MRSRSGSLAAEAPPGYLLIRRIGSGAFGQCWLARHVLTGCQVAIKVVGINFSDAAEHEREMERLEREVSIWKDLEHRNIAQLYEVISLHASGGAVYLATEYGGEGELFSLLERNPNGMPEDQTLAIFAQVCSAVAYMHAMNVAHRDIKLENIFMTADNTAKLGDFTFATRTARDHLCEEWLGSAEYSAPEVLKNEPYDPQKADSWSLGVVLFALLTGYLPFSKVEDDCALISDLEKKVKSRVINCELEVPSTLSAPTREILGGLFSYDPAKRWTVARVLEHPSLRLHLDETADEVRPKRDLLGQITIADLPGIAERRGKLGQAPDAAYALAKIIAHNADKFGPANLSERSAFSSPELPGIGPDGVGGGGKTWLARLFAPAWSTPYRNVGGRSNNTSTPSLNGDSM